MGAVKKEIIASVDKKISKPEWIGLTDDEITLMAYNDDEGGWSDLRLRSCWHEGYLEGARAIQKLLKEKNHD